MFKLALRTAEVLHLDVLADSRADGEIVLRRGSRATTGVTGDRLAIWFERVEGGHACDVRILARKAAMVTMNDDEWPPYFFRQMKVTAADDAAEAE